MDSNHIRLGDLLNHQHPLLGWLYGHPFLSFFCLVILGALIYTLWPSRHHK
ncbi:hypothetical protein [Dongshaea marina]|uniref:hypothetical protein n=1 Tax=Dongshaea marina TaxID=2047966 RepID=UPI00131F0183|nr:hypothetical protein [Dongshaea marina]